MNYNEEQVVNINKAAQLANFMCPLNVSAHEAMCPECEQREKCTEKDKKIWPVTCGCGGHYECLCGFKYTFCFRVGLIFCPFCGRIVEEKLKGIDIMDEYNPDAKCPKCGCTGIKNKFWKKGQYKEYPIITHYGIDGDHCYNSCREDIVESHIERTCCNCGHTWQEAPLDKKDSSINEVIDAAVEYPDVIIKQAAKFLQEVAPIADRVGISCIGLATVVQGLAEKR
jgi:hypothetical protein